MYDLRTTERVLRPPLSRGLCFAHVTIALVRVSQLHRFHLHGSLWLLVTVFSPYETSSRRLKICSRLQDVE